MAENKPDDLESLLDVSAADQPKAGDEDLAMASNGDLARVPADETMKDTLEKASLQAELARESENPVEFDGSSSDNPGDPLQPEALGRKPASGSKSHTEDAEDRDHAIVDEKEERLIAELVKARLSLTELMAWKEDLRLLAMSNNLLAAYYDNWTKEANLFFRRLVIINKRLETHRNKKRA